MWLSKVNGVEFLWVNCLQYKWSLSKISPIKKKMDENLKSIFDVESIFAKYLLTDYNASNSFINSFIISKKWKITLEYLFREFQQYSTNNLMVLTRKVGILPKIFHSRKVVLCCIFITSHTRKPHTVHDRSCSDSMDVRKVFCWDILELTFVR